MISHGAKVYIIIEVCKKKAAFAGCADSTSKCDKNQNKDAEKILEGV
jgi:hypothetical protein